MAGGGGGAWLRAYVVRTMHTPSHTVGKRAVHILVSIHIYLFILFKLGQNNNKKENKKRIKKRNRQIIFRLI